MRRTAFLASIICLSLILAGCLPRATNISISDVKFDWNVLPKVTGRIANSGGEARYVELAIKLTHPDDPNHIYATGWTNFVNFGANESRPFTIYFSNTPPGQFKYYYRWSTKVGEAMF